MFTIIRALSVKRLLTEQAPVLLISVGIAEKWYKFHSFILECGAFLVTWLLLDFLVQTVRVKITGKR